RDACRDFRNRRPRKHIRIHHVSRKQHQPAKHGYFFRFVGPQFHQIAPGPGSAASFTKASSFSVTLIIWLFCSDAPGMLSLVRNRGDLSRRLTNFSKFAYKPSQPTVIDIHSSVSLPSMTFSSALLVRSLTPASWAAC